MLTADFDYHRQKEDRRGKLRIDKIDRNSGAFLRTDIAENLFTVPGLLSPSECADLIDKGEGMGFEAASVATPAGPKMMTAVRNNAR